MKSPLNIPAKKRLFKIVVVCVLLPGVLWTWWYWPRENVKFAGRWVRVTMGKEWADQLLELQLAPNRTGYLRTPSTRLRRASWWTEENQRTLCFQPGNHTGWRGIEEFIGALFGEGQAPICKEVIRFSIIESTRDRMKYRPIGPPGLVEQNATHDFVLERWNDEIPISAHVKLAPSEIAANSPPGSLIGVLSVEDHDMGPNVTFSFVDGGNNNDDFEINEKQLRTRSRFEQR